MSAAREHVASERALSLAERLLAGAGVATLHAYRLHVTLDSLAHGIQDGMLLVSCQLDDDHPVLAEATEIRLDITLQAAHADVPITSASAHLLGLVSWLDERETRQLRAKGLPGLLDVPLNSPTGRLGMISASRLLLHDFTGTTAIELGQYLSTPAPFVDAWEAHDVVAALSDEQLRDICWATMTGTIPGEFHSHSAPPMCTHTIGRAFILDVDRHGITVMLTGAEEIIAVFAQFASPASTLLDLSWSVSRLAMDSAPTRTQRI